MLKIKLNLAKLKSSVMDFKKKDGTPVKCLIIPIEENHLFFSDKTGAVYIDLVGFESDKLTDWTHSVKQSLPKEVRDKLTKEEQYAYPYLGNVNVGGRTDETAVQSQALTEIEPIGEPLPF